MSRPLPDPALVHLEKGSHNAGSDQYCLEEYVSVLAGDAWSDSPTSVSPVIAAFGRVCNDRWTDEERQLLIPFAAMQIGTADQPELDQKRAYLCADRAVRVFAPITLRAFGKTEAATRLEALAPIVDQQTTHVAAHAAADADADADAAYAADAADAAAAAAAAHAAAHAADAAADADADAYAYAAAAAARKPVIEAALQLLKDLCTIS